MTIQFWGFVLYVFKSLETQKFNI